MNAFRALKRSEWSFDFAVGASGYYDREIRELGGRIELYPQPSEVGIVRFARSITGIIERGGPYCGVHSHVQFLNGAVMCAASIAKAPVRIAHSHTTGDCKRNTVVRRLYRGLMRALILRYATDRVSCGSEAARYLFGRGARSARVLTNAIDLSLYEDLPRDKDRLRRELGLPAGRPLLGQIGRFADVKNHAFTLKVFCELLRRVPAAMLVLVGEGPIKADVLTEARRLGLAESIIESGVRRDIPQIMAALDHLILPSQWEGLPMILVEAQAAGLRATASAAVTREADLGLGLIEFIDLRLPITDWAEAVAQAMAASTTSPHWATRRAALEERSYDLGGLACRLDELYSSCGGQHNR